MYNSAYPTPPKQWFRVWKVIVGFMEFILCTVGRHGGERLESASGLATVVAQAEQVSTTHVAAWCWQQKAQPMHAWLGEKKRDARTVDRVSLAAEDMRLSVDRWERKSRMCRIHVSAEHPQGRRKSTLPSLCIAYSRMEHGWRATRASYRCLGLS